jgi:hypothetical protein
MIFCLSRAPLQPERFPLESLRKWGDDSTPKPTAKPEFWHRRQSNPDRSWRLQQCYQLHHAVPFRRFQSGSGWNHDLLFGMMLDVYQNIGQLCSFSTVISNEYVPSTALLHHIKRFDLNQSCVQHSKLRLTKELSTTLEIFCKIFSENNTSYSPLNAWTLATHSTHRQSWLLSISVDLTQFKQRFYDKYFKV